MKPVTSTVIITSSITFWNNYSQAIFFLPNKRSYTLPLAISSYYTETGADWNLVAAAALLGVIPIVTLFLCLQKYFIKGFAAGAVKG
jgi:raffinose/stachyose/melibiose transport system permease protein